jgi:hypothetical protein
VSIRDDADFHLQPEDHRCAACASRLRLYRDIAKQNAK